MSKLIIWVRGRPALNGFKIREFQWSPNHGCYIYLGRELTDAEFNPVFEKAMKTNEDIKPKVKVIELSAPPTHDFTTQPPPTVEAMVDEAMAVLRRHAPHRLKRKMGRPAKVSVAA